MLSERFQGKKLRKSNGKKKEGEDKRVVPGESWKKKGEEFKRVSLTRAKYYPRVSCANGTKRAVVGWGINLNSREIWGGGTLQGNRWKTT